MSGARDRLVAVFILKKSKFFTLLSKTCLNYLIDSYVWDEKLCTSRNLYLVRKKFKLVFIFKKDWMYLMYVFLCLAIVILLCEPLKSIFFSSLCSQMYENWKCFWSVYGTINMLCLSFLPFVFKLLWSLSGSGVLFSHNPIKNTTFEAQCNVFNIPLKWPAHTITCNNSDYAWSHLFTSAMEINLNVHMTSPQLNNSRLKTGALHHSSYIFMTGQFIYSKGLGHRRHRFMDCKSREGCSPIGTCQRYP